MNRSFNAWLSAAALICGAIILQSPTTAAPWVSAYYCSWTLTSPAPANLDLRAVTHLMFFALKPNPDGSLSDPNATMSSSASAVKAAAHNAGRKVLICIGGGGTAPQFESAINPSNQSTFVQNIVNWVVGNGYDGVDIDMEPLSSADGPAFQSFIRNLRTALGRKLLITVGAEPSGDATIFTPIQSDVDQINVMTYDLSGPWSGWCSWYNSNLYSAGQIMPSNGHAMPSCDGSIENYIGAGIAPSKLAIAAAFYGTQWTGDCVPMQSITGVTVQNITYEEIADKYYNGSNSYWDPKADASYLSLAITTNQFISYDSQQLCKDKVDYVLKKGLGGLMCWNIGQQYCPTHPTSDQNPLLTAIYTELASRK